VTRAEPTASSYLPQELELPRRNYREGQWFLIDVPAEYVPNRTQRFGAGLIARGKRGNAVFAYIFGPWDGPPSVEDLAKLRHDQALLSLVMPDDYLRTGRFPLIGANPQFSREQWPMPELGMYMGGDNEAWAIRTNPDEPFEALDKRPVTPAVAVALPAYALSGYATFYRKLSDPSTAAHRISHAYRWVTSDEEDAQQWWGLVTVDFIGPPSASERMEELRERLARDGWCVPAALRTSPDTPRVWITATREGSELRTSLPEIDREMSELASLYGVEYDGHGVTARGDS
jgi:Immunity protein 26